MSNFVQHRVLNAHVINSELEEMKNLLTIDCLEEEVTEKK